MHEIGNSSSESRHEHLQIPSLDMSISWDSDLQGQHGGACFGTLTAADANATGDLVRFMMGHHRQICTEALCSRSPGAALTLRGQMDVEEAMFAEKRAAAKAQRGCAVSAVLG